MVPMTTPLLQTFPKKVWQARKESRCSVACLRLTSSSSSSGISNTPLPWKEKRRLIRTSKATPATNRGPVPPLGRRCWSIGVLTAHVPASPQQQSNRDPRHKRQVFIATEAAGNGRYDFHHNQQQSHCRPAVADKPKPRRIGGFSGTAEECQTRCEPADCGSQ